MSKLMPGYVRNQGIELYEQGELRDIRVEGDTVLAVIAGLKFIFSLDDSQIACPCDLFAKKGFCHHLAAMEYYLKNDSQGRSLAEQLQSSHQQVEEASRQKTAGSEFLAKLGAKLEDTEQKFSLSAEGDYQPSERNLLWTLRIRRLPDTRTYIIRDIKAFLKLVSQQAYYQIGKNYYEPLSLYQFDKASRDFLDFLWRLLPNSLDFDTSFYLPNFGRSLRLSEENFEKGLGLMQALSSFSFTINGTCYEEAAFQMLSADAGLFDFKVEVEQNFIELAVAQKDCYPFFKSSYLFYQGRFYELCLRQQVIFHSFTKLEKEDEKSRKLQLALEDKNLLSLLLVDFQQMGTVQAPRNFEIHDFTASFAFSLLPDDGVRLQLSLDFNNYWVSNQEELENLPFSPHYQKLSKILKLMELNGFEAQFNSQIQLKTSHDFYRFYTETLPAFEEAGDVSLSEDLSDMYCPSESQISLERTGNFLEVAFDFEGISEDEISAAYQSLASEAPYFVSQTGQLIIFDEEAKRVHQTLQELRTEVLPSGRLRTRNLSAVQLAHSLKGFAQIRFSQDFNRLVEDLSHPESFAFEEPELGTELREYQSLGVRWMSMLAHYGLGGILADDMGLGKTLQTIAFLAGQLKEGHRALILAPSSLVYNWQDEFAKFAPQLDVAVSYGSKSKRTEILNQDHQVTVTSYSSFRQDFDIFQSRDYDVLILDEAQVMKNEQTKIANSLRQFPVKTCFALSGTPVENRLSELWSIFQVVLPDLLPAKRAFNKLSASQVARMISPFVLRRKKEEVLTELPDLIEINHINELTDEQKAVYLAQIQQLQNSLATASDSEINRKKLEILSGITRLRQICDTPQLFMPGYQGDSGKLASLRQLLLQIQEGEHRVLIFSQFRTMLDIIEQQLEELGMNSYKITGSTKAGERQAITRAFNAGSRDAVLISLKAGGVGINLTGADTVILVDLWWNPAVEEQAVSRAYRMGQQKNVEFYRLITRGTIEEKIQALQDSKRQLITSVLDGDAAQTSLSADDIREILNLPVQ